LEHGIKVGNDMNLQNINVYSSCIQVRNVPLV